MRRRTRSGGGRARLRDGRRRNGGNGKAGLWGFVEHGGTPLPALVAAWFGAVRRRPDPDRRSSSCVSVSDDTLVKSGTCGQLAASNAVVGERAKMTASARRPWSLLLGRVVVAA
ncbi:unnamed protein product [Urochloa humidicola]